MLHDINKCPQIPPEKRIDISLPPPSEGPELEIDTESPYPAAAKSLKDLLAEVPHLTYAQATETKPNLVADTQKDEAGAYPAHFLSPDDVDNYLHLIDNKIGEEPIPTLAPVANAEANPPIHPLLRNPNSSTSWLRQNAPHIFLQYDENHTDNHHDEETGHKKGRGKGGERGGKGAGSRGGRKSTGAKAAAAAATEHQDSNAEEEDNGLTPAPKGKRKRDDDGGYRPKGGSGARPTKKKRKSEVEGTPSEGRKKVKTAKDVGDGGD